MDANKKEKRVLVVAAHPDDLDFGCCGTVAQWTHEGTHVAYCIITDGAGGGRHTGVSREQLAEIREREQREAGAIVGVHELTFLGYPDGALEISLDLRKDITRVIRKTKPNIVVCQSPERNWERIFASHPDHLVAGEATLCAVYPDSRNPYSYPELISDEGLPAHIVEEVWITASPRADFVNDISDVFDMKLAALQSHKSQIDEPKGFEERIRAMSSGIAQRFELPKGSYAEVFQHVSTL